MQDAIIFTGATSGFGAAALKIVTEYSNAPIIVGARTPETVTEKYKDRVTALPLDLSSFASVRNFLNGIPADATISTLALNAGLTLSKPTISEDGIETTFQVNYLSHVMIYKALEDRLVPDARVLTTGSGTHDPDERTPIPSPRYADVALLVDPSKQPKRDRLPIRSAGRAYSTSKLCCILMAQQIATLRPNGSAYSFDPGFLPDTNLAREAPKVAFALAKRVIPLMLANKDRTGSIETTAPVYADLILGGDSPAANGGYVAVRGGKLVAAEPSKLAKTPGLAETLWRQTEELLAQQPD